MQFYPILVSLVISNKRLGSERNSAPIVLTRTNFSDKGFILVLHLRRCAGRLSSGNNLRMYQQDHEAACSRLYGPGGRQHTQIKTGLQTSRLSPQSLLSSWLALPDKGPMVYRSTVINCDHVLEHMSRWQTFYIHVITAPVTWNTWTLYNVRS